MNDIRANELDSILGYSEPKTDAIKDYMDWLYSTNCKINLATIQNKKFKGFILDRDEATKRIKLYVDDTNINAIWTSINIPVDNIPDETFNKGKFTTDTIGTIQFFNLDIDPVKPEEFNHHNATDEEHEAAYNKMLSIKDYLNFPIEPLIVDSGNGYYLYYRINLPNTEKNRNIISKLVDHLVDKFGIDAPSKDIAHIYGVPETFNRKKETPDRPSRKRKVISSYPVEGEELTEEEFITLAKKFITVDEIDFTPEKTVKEEQKKEQTEDLTIKAKTIIEKTIIEKIKSLKHYSKEHKHGSLKDAFEFGCKEVVNNLGEKSRSETIQSILGRLVFYVGYDWQLLNEVFKQTRAYLDYSDKWTPAGAELRCKEAINYHKEKNGSLYKWGITVDNLDGWTEEQESPIEKVDNIIKASDVGIPPGLQACIKYLASENRQDNLWAYSILLNTFSAMIGRKVKIKVGNENYKTSLKQVILAGSGQNKTSNLNAALRFLTDITKKYNLKVRYEIESATTIEGFISYFGKTFAKTKKDNKGKAQTITWEELFTEREKYAQEAKEDMNGFNLFIDEAYTFIDMLTKSKNAGADNMSRFCELLEDIKDISYKTKGDGICIIPDPCFTMIMAMVSDDYYELCNNPKAERKGVVHRMLPILVSDYVLELDENIRKMNKEATKTMAEKTIELFSEKIKGVTKFNQLEIVDLPYYLDGGEEKRLQKEAINGVAIIKDTMEGEKSERIDQITSKTAIQAKKIAAIHCLIGKWAYNGEIEAKEFYKGAFYFCQTMHYSCISSASTRTVENDEISKVMAYVGKWTKEKKYNKLTLRNIATAVRISNISSYKARHQKVAELLGLLVVSGEIEKVALPSGRGEFYRKVN